MTLPLKGVRAIFRTEIKRLEIRALKMNPRRASYSYSQQPATVSLSRAADATGRPRALMLRSSICGRQLDAYLRYGLQPYKLPHP